MSEPVTPLLFPETFNSPGLWKELGKAHGLAEKDFRWLAHLKLTTDTLRRQQTPAMITEQILLNVDKQAPIRLPGSFVIRSTPDDNGEILYTPYDGLKKYATRDALRTQLQERLNSSDEQTSLFAFLAFSQRKLLRDGGKITLSFATISGDVFEDQADSIKQGQTLNAQALHEELKRLPVLKQMLEGALGHLLREHFGNLSQSQTRVRFSAPSSEQVTTADRDWPDTLTLSEAVLFHYRHQGWPSGRTREFSHPGRNTVAGDQAQWEDAIRAASGKLPALLFRQLQDFWEAPSAEGSSRITLFGQFLEDQGRAEFMLKRESGILDAAQFDTLHQLIHSAGSITLATRFPVIESVRLWEREANYVELAGSLMISDPHAYLYTPSQGLQLLKDYEDLKTTLQAKFTATGHEDELYGLLSLEERGRFLGFDRPQVSGERIAGKVFRVLFETILTKQRQNIEYALRVFRLSDGLVDLHALFDKALDIRSMLQERLLTLDTRGRWSTHPVLVGSQNPSMVLAARASAGIKTFRDIEQPILQKLAAQPTTSMAAQRAYLETIKPELAHAWYVGVTGEARLRTLNGSLLKTARAIVETVINADRPARKDRLALNGFRPDAYALTLKPATRNKLVPLNHCVLMTERGGLDAEHSGLAVLWTPAWGIEVFANVAVARQIIDRRLRDAVQRLALLENMPATQPRFHQRFSLGPFQSIEGNVLHHRAQSGIEHFLTLCENIRTTIPDPVKRSTTLAGLIRKPLDTSLELASGHARAIHRQQTLPTWLGMAPVKEQKLHIELLEQWFQSVVDDKDYLSGLPALSDYVELTLKSLLDNRFPSNGLNPRDIEITPNLALVGPARDLVDFALNHINIAQGTGFRIRSKTATALPANLNQSAITQLLRSLAIPTTYKDKIVSGLSVSKADGQTRKRRFIRQVPWQLLQHAHCMKLQQHLSQTAFDFIRQVLDMPDAVARASVAGARAMACPLSLIKTAGATAVSALGMYIFGPAPGHQGPLVLYAPYAEQAFHEFEDEAGLVAALNTPGALQDLLVRRLPTAQQAIFRTLFNSTVGQTSEMSLHLQPIDGNLLEHLFDGNLNVLQQMLGSQNQADGQSDWDTIKILFSEGIQQVSRLFQGKLACAPLLWQAYDDFKNSAEALQNRHWKKALSSFIEGAVQMVQTFLLPERSAVMPAPLQATEQEAQTVLAPSMAEIEATSPLRTELHSFEATDISLKDLTRSTTEFTYKKPPSLQSYAAIDGKVYPVTRSDTIWRLSKDRRLGPKLLKSDARLVLDMDRQFVHYGKAISKMYDRRVYTQMRRTMLNIEARGMDEIRKKHPQKARALVQAIDLARFYAFNCLHNLALLRAGNSSARVESFLKDLFDVPQITADVLGKVKDAIEPICKALVDPTDDLLNTERFIVGSNNYLHDVIAFVLDGDEKKKVHFTEHFFNQQLQSYIGFVDPSFDIDAHAQASTLIHEFSHQFSKALDIASTRAREPFIDLISTVTTYGSKLKNELELEQSLALSLSTPRAQLFSEWNSTLQMWVGIDQLPELKPVSDEILGLTASKTIQEARNAFFDQQTPNARINVILRNADSIARLICETGRHLDPLSP